MEPVLRVLFLKLAKGKLHRHCPRVFTGFPGGGMAEISASAVQTLAQCDWNLKACARRPGNIFLLLDVEGPLQTGMAITLGA